MGFLDWITGKIECPRCGTAGAKNINGQIHCPNPTCSYFSKKMGKGDTARASDSITFTEPGNRTADSPAWASANVPAGSFAIRYRDFRGQERTFVAQAASAQRNKNHIRVQVAPKGARIVLARNRILNLNEVDAAFPQRLEPGQDWPTPRERQVMTYHKKRRSTSPLYESIRAKYPNW
jgi:hypothetical protein